MNFEALISQIQWTDDYFKEKISRTIDRHLTIRNWLIGFYIVEFEQKGEDRAKYGIALLDSTAKKLNRKGLSARNLKLFRQFYFSFPQIVQTLSAFSNDIPIVQTLSAQLDAHEIKRISQALSDQYKKASSTVEQIQPEKLLNHLSFSHFVELIKIIDPLKRTYYEVECIKSTWSVRELKRQINCLSFERSAAAKNSEFLRFNLNENSEKLTPNQIIKTPYVFDFLGLPDTILGSESDLEDALIQNLKNFILELGHGFCFEAQQKRIILGGEYFFIDLVFYHRILKCHVLIELKVDAFTHANAGQLNTYLKYYKLNIQKAEDRDPIGILLCTNQNDELVNYALGGMDKNLFVSQYQTALPSTEQLEAFLKQEMKKLKKE